MVGPIAGGAGIDMIGFEMTTFYIVVLLIVVVNF